MIFTILWNVIFYHDHDQYRASLQALLVYMGKGHVYERQYLAEVT